MPSPLMRVAASLSVLLAASGCERNPAKAARPTLQIHVAASLASAVKDVAMGLAQERDIPVDFVVGGSGALLARLAVDLRGDLFIPAEDSYAEDAAALGLVRERVTVAVQQPCIGVRRGNPLKLASLQDLMRADLKLGLPLPDSAAIGKVAETMLAKTSPSWHELAAKAVVMKPTVNALANDLTIGSIDAAIIWVSTAEQYDEVDPVLATPLSDRREPVPAIVLTCAQSPELAAELIARLTSPAGREALAKTGLGPPP